MINKKMQKRIFFGSIMLAILGGLFTFDYRNYFDQIKNKTHTTPAFESLSNVFSTITDPAWLVTGLLVLLLVLGFVELRKMLKNIDIDIHPVSGIFGTIFFALFASGWVNKFLLANINCYANCLKSDSAMQAGGQLASKAAMLNPLTINFSIVFLFVVIAVFLEQMIRGRLIKALERISGTLLGILWLGLGGAMILSIRLDFGPSYLIIFLIATKSTDIGAYFTGSMIGKHKMIPWLSPGKSWEGLVGGLLFSGIVSVVLSKYLGLDISYFRETSSGVGAQSATLTSFIQAGPGTVFWAIFGMVCGLTGQLGDLCESLIKRSTKVKDSASLIPEFGGVLDLIDSPLIASAFGLALLSIWSFIGNFDKVLNLVS